MSGDVLARLAALRAAVHGGGAQGVHDAAQHLGGVAQQLAPVDEATLRRSMSVTHDEHHAVVSFDTPYAARQHEELTWQHPRGGQAKYLEQPMSTDASAMRALMGQGIAKEMRR